ncbi:MAG: hypothetical protein ACREQV_06040, partial [Candidatus Binatia bacterium]
SYCLSLLLSVDFTRVLGKWAMVEFHNNKVGGLVKYDYQELNTLNEDLAFNERLKEAVERLEKLKKGQPLS